MKIFITGATGFMGHELMKALHARGHAMTALVRSPDRIVGFPPDVGLVTGTLETIEPWRARLAGHDALVHVAALVKMWARDPSEFDRVNVAGTEAILRAAADAGVGRLVYASSFMALGPSDDGAALREDDPRRTSVVNNDYERTKHLADIVARRLIDEGLPLRVLYPGIIYGPGNMTHGNIVARSLVPFLEGRMPVGLPLKAWSYAFVDDVVAGFVKVAETETPSRRYILGGDNHTGPEFYRAVQSITGKRPPLVNLPLAMARLAGYGEYALAELFGREPTLLTHEVARIYEHAWAYDSSRAKAELGYRITPLDEGLRRTIDWLRTAGHLKASKGKAS